MYQPVGSVVFVVDPAVFERVSRFSVTEEPIVVKLTLPVPVSARTVLSTNRLIKVPGERTNDRTRIKADTIAILARAETSWFLNDMKIETFPES